MQATLVALAQTGDQDAMLTLLVQLRPGLCSLTRWVAATEVRPGSLDEAATEVVSTLGELILAHRLDRRPERIAANLLLDTRQRLWRIGSREHRVRLAALAAAATTPTGGRPGHDRPDTVVGTLSLTAALITALGRLSGDRESRATTAELAYRAWFLDQPRDEIEQELGLGREAISSRLYRLRSLLRRELIDAAA
jgi:hypothetical protein